MKDLLWDNTLSVQVREIDDDHRKLVDLFNLLSHAVNEEEPEELVEVLLEELISCTDCHFKHEERLMLKYRYDGFEEHRREHRELIHSIHELQETRRNKGRPVTADDIEFLEHWLTGHILGPDMDLGAWLNEQA